MRGILPVPPLAGFANVCQALPETLPVYAVQLPGLAQHLTQDLLGDGLDDEAIEVLLEQGLDPHAIEHAAVNVLGKIRSVQPHGPYRLGSWCTGGLVTFEVAQLLRRSGEEVECLVLVDSFLPAPATAVSAEDPGPSVSDLTQTTAASLVWFVCRSLNERGRRLPFDLDDLLATLEGLPPAERWQAALDAAKRAQLVGPDTTNADLERTYRLYRANQRAVARILRNYRAEPYDGPLTVLRAKRLALRDSGETLGWNRVATQPVTVLQVHGDHGTVLNRHAKEVAAGFLRVLGEGRERIS